MGPFGDDGPGPTFSPALFYVGERPARFEKAFAGIGAVLGGSHEIRLLGQQRIHSTSD